MSKKLKYQIIIRETTTIDRLFEVSAENDRAAQGESLGIISSGKYRNLPTAGTQHDVTPLTITRQI